jgi:hypothetical protein
VSDVKDGYLAGDDPIINPIGVASRENHAHIEFVGFLPSFRKIAKPSNDLFQ